MCELFGFTAKKETDITPCLRTFFSHGSQNPNGWGMARYIDGRPVLDLEPAASDESAYLARLLEHPIRQKLTLAHIRKATVGGVSIANCHPFCRQDNSGRSWLLMHNGTVFSGLSILSYKERMTDGTDSECILLYLIDRLNEKQRERQAPLSAYERFCVVDDLVSELSYRNKLNLILSDGELLYVHANMRGTLFFKQLDGGLLFATVPLDSEGWSDVPLTTLLAYQDGQLCYKGRNHHNEYISAIDVAAGPLDYTI